MRTLRPTLIALLLVIILLGIKFIFFPGNRTKANIITKDGKKPSSAVTVFVIGDSALRDKIYANGTIVANEEAELKVEASGNIKFLNIPEGASVTAGTLLLKINDDDLQAQFEKIKVQLKLAKDNEERQRSLLQISAISKQEYEIALANYNSNKADSAYHKALILKTEVRAPFNGILGIRNVSIGSYITPAVSIASIHQIDPVKIDFALPEKYSDLFKLRDLISFKTEGSAQTYSAKVIVKDPKINVSSRSVRYRAISNNPKHELLPGAFVRIELTLNKKVKTLFVPTAAIVPVLKGKKVFIIRNGNAEGKMVETGLRTEEHVQILSGLSVGDSVILNGNFQLNEGAPVKVISGKKK